MLLLNFKPSFMLRTKQKRASGHPNASVTGEAAMDSSAIPANSALCLAKGISQWFTYPNLPVASLVFPGGACYDHKPELKHPAGPL